MDKSDSPTTFCEKPFRTIHTNVTGDVRVCCYVQRPIGNFRNDSIEDIWKSDFAREVRESIYDQSFSHCDKTFCSLAARASSKSLELPQVKEELVDLRKQYGLEPNIEHIALQHDDSCNLSCPSCRSGLIYANAERQAKTIQIQDEWLKSSVIQDARLLTVSANGDPFASNVYMDFLRKITVEKFPLIKINFLTNAILLTRKRWDELSNLHYAVQSIFVSIDAATAQTYAIVRRGGDFGKLQNNLEFISELRKAGKIQHFAIKFVMSSTNFREMPEFVRMGKRLGCDEVKFQLIVKFAHLSLDDYNDLAIHQPDNPHYPELVEVLKDPILSDPIVHMMNFHAFEDDPVTSENNLSQLMSQIQQERQEHSIVGKIRPLIKWCDDHIRALKSYVLNIWSNSLPSR